MKKTLRYYLLVLLSVVATVFAALGLAACDAVSGGKKVDALIIENAKVSFKIGDEFEYGEGFTVYAHYVDDTQEDVTDKIEVTKENGFNMNVAGNYQITVRYGGKSEIYTIYVSDFENILRKIELDTEGVQKTYKLGDKNSFEGLKIRLTHENAQGVMINSTTTSLKGYKVEIRHESGTVTEEVFDALGTYTITVSYGSIKDSYEVLVDGVNLSTVQGAIAVSKAFKSNVVSGVQHMQSALKGASLIDLNHYEYKFGNNYTYVKETRDTPKTEWHCTIEDDEIFVVEFQDGNMANPGSVQAAMMEGARTPLWYSADIEYGIENTLANLYKHAKACSNNDLVETVDEENRVYTFKFSGLEFRDSGSDFYDTTVSFKLSDKLTVEHAEYDQKYWEYNENNLLFETGNDGKTNAIARFSYELSVVVDQVTGERTETNPYPKESFKIQSFDLKYKNEILEDNATIDCSVTDRIVYLSIENIMPVTGSFDHYPLYFNFEGSFNKDVDSNGGILSKANEFTITRNIGLGGKIIEITLYNGCEFKLILKTSGITKTVQFNVKGNPPTSLTAQIRNDASGVFNNGNSKTTGIGGSVYFKAAVNQYANAEQTAAITAVTGAGVTVADATVEEVELNGVKCFKFLATKAGVYTVKLSSTVSSLSCTYTFTVQEAPDYAGVLVGKYTVTDVVGNIYLVAFTPENEGEEVKGTLVVSRTPTDDNDNPITAQAKTQTLSYSVDFGANEIKLTHVSGTNLGILLSVDLSGRLILNDERDANYTLTPVNE